MANGSGDDETLMHQAIHGYGHGHQLLAASQAFDDETANVLSLNSDSAPNTRFSAGDYLTGYGLVDGRYVIARTWNETDAERPNTVVTRSFILPRQTPPGFSVQRVLDLLERPVRSELDGRLPPIGISEIVGDPLALTREEAEIAVRYYRSPSPLASDPEYSRCRIALGIWTQLWRSARYDLLFCTAPDTDRFARREHALRFERPDAIDVIPLDLRASTRAIVEDLEHPGPFREFIHFVGSGERAVGLIEPFAEAFSLLNDKSPSLDAFTSLLLTYKGTEPQRLRRLKRRLLSFQGERPRWPVDPFRLLRELAEGPLGKAVYASDASLDSWIRLCWDIDAQRTASLLPESDPELVGAPARPLTAVEGIAAAFATHSSELITPATLQIAARLNRPAALAAVWDRNETELWNAWAQLDPPLVMPAASTPSTEYEWNVPVKGLRGNPRALSRLLRQHPEAMDALISLANSSPSSTDRELDLNDDAKRYIRTRLEGSDPELVGLARLADDRALPARLDVAAWRQLLTHSADEAALATGYLIARSGRDGLWEIATLTAAFLYRTLSSEDAFEAWQRLNPHIRGDRKTWDRCDRLIEDYADMVRHLNDDAKVQALALLQKRNPAAARALETALRPPESKKFNWLDPTTWV